MRRTRTWNVVVLGGLLLSTAFVGVGSAEADTSTVGTASAITAATVEVPRPLVSLPSAPGLGIQTLQAQLDQMPQYDYVQDEYFFEGNARAYQPIAPLTNNGQWKVQVDSTAPYKTRMIVRRPRDVAKFNGTVVVEWLNVTAGFDTSPDWNFGRVELMRRGFIWVGVSAQYVGVENAPLGLKPLDPARYGTLVHPGDQYSYDIFAQTAKAITAPLGVAPLPEYPVRRLIADGESQSASRLTTYVNALSIRDQAYDAYLVHSRSASSASLNVSGAGASMPSPVFVRTDLSRPVLVVEAETDVPRYAPARQADSAYFRSWEVAGTADVDLYALGPDSAGVLGCALPVNSGPHHYVIHTALRSLWRWMRSPSAVPPSSPLITLNGSGAIVRDGFGNALGGIRTPHLDIPVATLSGTGNSPGLCSLFGTTTKYTPSQLTAFYGSKNTYLYHYLVREAAALNSKFLLTDDGFDVLLEAVAVPFA